MNNVQYCTVEFDLDISLLSRPPPILSEAYPPQRFSVSVARILNSLKTTTLILSRRRFQFTFLSVFFIFLAFLLPHQGAGHGRPPVPGALFARISNNR